VQKRKRHQLHMRPRQRNRLNAVIFHTSSISRGTNSLGAQQNDVSKQVDTASLRTLEIICQWSLCFIAFTKCRVHDRKRCFISCLVTGDSY
jgi:hypothetical protein